MCENNGFPFSQLFSESLSQENLDGIVQKLTSQKYACHLVAEQLILLDQSYDSNGEKHQTILPALKEITTPTDVSFSPFSYEMDEKLVKARTIQLSLEKCSDDASCMMSTVTQNLTKIQSFYEINEVVLTQLNKLKLEEWLAQWKFQIVNAIIRRLSISSQSIENLSSGVTESDKLDSKIFDILKEVQTVHHYAQEFHCLMKNLINWFPQDVIPPDLNESPQVFTFVNQSMTVTVLKQAEDLLNVGIEKLLTLVLRELRHYTPTALPCGNDSDNALSHVMINFQYISKAINILKLYPSMYKYAFQEISSARRLFLKKQLENLLLSCDTEVLSTCPVGLHFCLNPLKLKSSKSLFCLLLVFYQAISAEFQLASLLMLDNSKEFFFQNEKESSDKVDADESKEFQKTSMAVEYCDAVFSEAVAVFTREVNRHLSELSDMSLGICEVYCLIACFTCSIVCLLESLEFKEKLNRFIGRLDLCDHLADHATTSVTRKCLELLESILDFLVNVWDEKLNTLKHHLCETIPTSSVDVPVILHDYIGDLKETVDFFSCLSHGHADFYERAMKDTGILQKLSQHAAGPLLQVLRSSSLNHEDMGHRVVYLINCFTFLEETLLSCEILKQNLCYDSQLKEEELFKLVKALTTSALNDLGLSLRLDKLREWNELSEQERQLKPLSTIPCLHPLTLSMFLHDTYNTLLFMDFPFKRLTDISSSVLQKKARKIILCNLLKAYQELCEGITIEDCFIPSFKSLLEEVCISQDDFCSIVGTTSLHSK